MICPYCDSTNVRYLEDVTNKHRIIGERGNLLLVEADPEETVQETSNERLECHDCMTEFNFPDLMEIEFKGGVEAGPDQGSKGLGKEPTGSVPDATTKRR